MTQSTWTFLTNHAQVLLCVASNPHITARDIAGVVGITERAVQRIVDDLERAGYLRRHREGRKNHYDVDLDQPFRHPAQRGRTVRDLFNLLLRYRAPTTESNQQTASADPGAASNPDPGGQPDTGQAAK